MPKTNLADAKKLKNKLDRLLIDDVTPARLAAEIAEKFEKTKHEDLIVSARTIRDYHSKLSAEEIAKLNSTYPVRLLKALQIISNNKETEDIREQARLFFATNKDAYEYEQLDRFVGVFDMYRPYWIKLGSRDFMRSRVRIMRRGGHYLFTEYQNWAQVPHVDICAGYLFPSRNSIVALCKSRSGKNVKFLSIGSLRDDPVNPDQLGSFSGSLIATSDQPPHPGHGFHCIRNEKSNHKCDFIECSEMKIKIDIYTSIMINQLHCEMDINEYKRIKEFNTGK